MRQVGAEQDQIAVVVVANAIAHKTLSITSIDESQFVLRMEMPVKPKLAGRFYSINKKGALRSSQFLNHGFHDTVPTKREVKYHTS